MAGTKKLSVVGNNNWEVEDDLRIMCRAKEIQMDEKRYSKVKELAKTKMTEIASIAGGESK